MMSHVPCFRPLSAQPLPAEQQVASGLTHTGEESAGALGGGRVQGCAQGRG